MASEEKKKKSPEAASGELTAEDLDKVTGGSRHGDNDDSGATGRGDSDDATGGAGGVITFGKE